MRIRGQMIGLVWFMAACSQATTVNSLSEVKGSLQSTEHKEAYSSSMSGQPIPDKFGGKQPTDKGFHSLQILLVPDNDYTVYLGIKPWSYLPGSAIAIACYASRPLPHATYERSDCDLSQHNVVLRVLKQTQNGYEAMTPIYHWVSRDNPLTAEWGDNTNLPGGIEADSPSTHLEGFDFAAYHLNAVQTAFGIRSSFSEGYAGGGAWYETLTLFAVFDGKLKAILSQPISYYSDVAGEWHKDGTRSHDVSEGTNIVIMQPHQVEGMRDIKIKSKAGHWSTVFVWDAGLQHYIRHR